MVGDETKYFQEGKVLVAAANPDMMEYYISPHDLVILGNRYESQLCAIEMEADCIIVCEGAAVSMTIRKLAQERGCTVMTTPYDTSMSGTRPWTGLRMPRFWRLSTTISWGPWRRFHRYFFVTSL